MNTYKFCFMNDDGARAYHVVEARRLAQALQIFYQESKSFLNPVRKMIRHYKVTNPSGRSSFRLIPYQHYINCPYRDGAK